MKTTQMVIKALVIILFTLGVFSAVHAEYKLGMLGATTGPYAPLGVAKKNGMMLAIEKVNKEGGIKGEEVVAVFEDTEGDPSKAISLAKKLIVQDKVVAVLDCASTAVGRAVSKVTEDHKIVQVNSAPRASIAINEPWPKYYFQTVHENNVDAQKIGEYLKKLGIKKASIIHDANQYGTSGALFQNEFFRKVGIEVVVSEKFQKEDRDLTPILIKAKNLGTEAVVVWGTVPTPAAIARNMKQLGMNVHYVGSVGSGSPKLVELAGDAAEGMVFTSALPYGKILSYQKPMFDAHLAKFGTPPNYFTALGWDCVALPVEAIKKAGGTKDHEKIRDNLEDLKEFYGVVGKYNMSPKDHNGLDTSSLFLIKIVGGKWTLLE